MSRWLSTFSHSYDKHGSALHEQRREGWLPWFKSPFREATPEEKERLLKEKDDTLLTTEAEGVEWLDLLLELALTTAFANLAENTELDSIKNVFSYFAFITLTWWIWACQVAYNMRFRQADRFHRICAFLQLMVFSGMAAFSKDFDIAPGIVSAQAQQDEELANSISLALNETTLSGLQATQFQEAHLSIVNDQGIAIILVLSRLLMLIQYTTVYYHARRLQRKSIMVHIGTVLLSMLLFFISAFVVGKEDSDNSSEASSASIAKIFLWYIAILVEVAGHFVSTRIPGQVKYRLKEVYERSATLFIVILGIGIDNITGQFKFIVGKPGFSASSVFAIMSFIVIIIGSFSLYFNSRGSEYLSSRRALLFFFVHFPFMTAIIIMLKGVASLLSFVNLLNTSEALAKGVAPLFSIIIQNQIVPTADQFPQIAQDLQKLGLSFSDLTDTLSVVAQRLADITDPNEAVQQTFSILLQLTDILFDQFDQAPEPGSVLSLKLDLFNYAPYNSSINYLDLYSEIASDLDRGALEPALWFAGSAGVMLVLLGLINLVRQHPRDRWEWGAVLSRIIGGFGFAALSIFDSHSGDQLYYAVLDEEGNLTQVDSPSIIWKFARSGWILPSFAILLILLNAVSIAMDYFAMRSYPEEANQKEEIETNSIGFESRSDEKVAYP